MKTTQSILPDPESAKQQTWRRNLQCYQYKHCTDHWLMQIDPCTSGWTRNTDGELVPLWLNGQQFPNELMKLAKQRAPMIRILYVTKKNHYHHHHHHHHKHWAHNNFRHLLQNTCCKMVKNRMTIALQATKEMNPTLTLLIMTVTEVTVNLDELLWITCGIVDKSC